MYAVIKIGGKQYKVFEGEILEIDKLQKNPGEQIEFGEVLLVVKNGEVKIGQPTVPGTKVTAKILEQIKGKKIRIARFKAKVRYRRVKGFRPLLTRVKIEKIG
ncbi:50S ribosomal protein L21 [Candidatus Gottesmanbacteria bacterium]|nr:50S ribosomal protein L21 [Candidatus Gottesmanbacteria bacterium]